MPLSRREQRLRRRARARVVQAIYAWGLLPRDTVSRVAVRLWDDIALGAEERAFAEPLLHAVEERSEEIDAVVASVTDNWRPERIGSIERAVLRAATAELLCGQEPPKAVLQEAVRLAERYAGPEAARFVNGVLDAVARRLRRI